MRQPTGRLPLGCPSSISSWDVMYETTFRSDRTFPIFLISSSTAVMFVPLQVPASRYTSPIIFVFINQEISDLAGVGQLAKSLGIVKSGGTQQASVASRPFVSQAPIRDAYSVGNESPLRFRWLIATFCTKLPQRTR